MVGCFCFLGVVLCDLLDCLHGLVFLVWVCCVGLVYSGGFLVVIMRMMGISVRWIVPVVIIMLVVWVCVRWLVVCRVSAVIVIIDAMIVAVSIGLRGFGVCMVFCGFGFLVGL